MQTPNKETQRTRARLRAEIKAIKNRPLVPVEGSTYTYSLALVGGLQRLVHALWKEMDEGLDGDDAAYAFRAFKLAFSAQGKGESPQINRDLGEAVCRVVEDSSDEMRARLRSDVAPYLPPVLSAALTARLDYFDALRLWSRAGANGGAPEPVPLVSRAV